PTIYFKGLGGSCRWRFSLWSAAVFTPAFRVCFLASSSRVIAKRARLRFSVYLDAIFPPGRPGGAAVGGEPDPDALARLFLCDRQPPLHPLLPDQPAGVTAALPGVWKVSNTARSSVPSFHRLR